MKLNIRSASSVLAIMGFVFVALNPLNSRAGSLSVTGALNYGLYDSGALGFGAGVTNLFGIGQNGIEVGAIYLSRGYESGGVSARAGFIHAPVMFRFGGMTSFGVGGFYDFGISSTANSSYGLTAGPRFTLPGGLFFDGRFNYNLDLDDANELLLLVGISI